MNLKDLFELYVKHVEHHFGVGTFDRDLYEISFLSQLNRYALSFKPMIKYAGKLVPFSMCTMVISSTSTGKDCSIAFLDPLKSKVYNELNKVYQHRYTMLDNAINIEEVEKPKAPGEFTVKSVKESTRSKSKERMQDYFSKIPSELTLASSNATTEGFVNYFISYGILAFGSISIESSEFADSFSDMSFRNMLELCAQLYDDPNKTSFKVTLSRQADKARNCITGIAVHSAFDRFKRDAKLFDSLLTFMRSSLARRSLFYFMNKKSSDLTKDAKIKHKENILKQKEEALKEGKDLKADNELMTEHLQGIIDIVYETAIKQYTEKFIQNSKLEDDFTFKELNMHFSLNREADYELAKYSLECSRKANKLNNKGTTIAIKLSDQIESQYHKALRIAALSSFYKPYNKGVIDIDDINYGISVVEKSSKYYEIVSKPTIIVDEICDYLKNTKEKVTVKELIDLEIMPDNISKPRLKDIWDRCREKLFQENMIFRSTVDNNSIIPQVWIEQLENTVDEIANISYSVEESFNDITMRTISIPFYDILKIPDIKKIGTGGFNNDSRSLSNINRLGNTLIFDVDKGDLLPIRKAKMVLKGLSCFIYPTKNNNKNKDGICCERYRIVMLCKQSLPYGNNKKTSENEFKEIYSMVCDHFGIPYDKSCCEPSRFFWIPEEAKTDLVLEKGRVSEPGEGVPLDLRYFMKNLKISHDLKSKSMQFESSKYWKAVGIKGILEKTISNAIITGQRNNSLLILSLSLMDYGLGFEEIKDYVYDVDDKFPSSIGSLENDNPGEIENTILSTLEKRMIEKGIYPDGKKANKERKRSVGEFEIDERFKD